MNEVIFNAGGISGDARSGEIHLAQTEYDEDNIYFFCCSNTLNSFLNAGVNSAVLNHRINIDSASITELIVFARVGTSRAAAVLLNREEKICFTSAQEFLQAPGIVQTALEGLLL